MVTPLWILAGATLVVGFLGIPVIGPFQDWITVPGHEHHGFSTFYNLIVPIASVGIAALAIWLGYMLFLKERWQYDILAGPFAWLYRFVENKYYLDDIYMRGIVKPVQYPISKAAYWTNMKIIDATVNGTASGTVATARATYRYLDQDVIDGAVNGAAGLTGMSGRLLRYIQSGNVQRYAAVLFAAVAIFVALFVIL
jgi:NADH-quinone oxidoreductase subunit L